MGCNGRKQTNNKQVPNSYSLYDSANLIRLDIPLSHYSCTCNNKFMPAILYPPTLSPTMCSVQLPSTAHLSQDITVSMVTKLLAGRQRLVVILLYCCQRQEIFLIRNTQTGSGPHTASCSVCIGVSFSGSRAAGTSCHPVSAAAPWTQLHILSSCQCSSALHPTTHNRIIYEQQINQPQ
jgi:hypothetical protein